MNASSLRPLNVTLFSPGMEQDTASPLRELTTGLAQGDDAAWAQFHREYGPGIFRQLLASTGGDHDLATEALQQTYLRVARHVRPCDAAAMFGAWLRIVARTALHDCRRRRVSFRTLLQRRHADPSDAPSDEKEEERLLTALDQALSQLVPEDRSLLEAKYFAGTEVRIIASQLAVSPKAVESRLTRARAQLRRHLLAALPRHD